MVTALQRAVAVFSLLAMVATQASAQLFPRDGSAGHISSQPAKVDARANKITLVDDELARFDALGDRDASAVVTIAELPKRRDFASLLQMAATLARRDPTASASVERLRVRATRLDQLAEADPALASLLDALLSDRQGVSMYASGAARGDAGQLDRLSKIGAILVHSPLGEEAVKAGTDMKSFRESQWNRFKNHVVGAREIYRVAEAYTVDAATAALKADQQRDLAKARDAGPNPMADLMVLAIVVGVAASMASNGGGDASSGTESAPPRPEMVRDCHNETVKEPDWVEWPEAFVSVNHTGASYTVEKCAWRYP